MSTFTDRPLLDGVGHSRLRAASRVARATAVRAGLSLALCSAFVGVAPPVRADTVASLLGDFTINQYCGLQVSSDLVKVHFAVVYGQLPALRELHEADADGDGVTTQDERDAHAKALAPALADRLALTVDGIRVPLNVAKWTSSLPPERSGSSMRIDIDYYGRLTPATDASIRSLVLANTNFPGRVGWHEMAVTSHEGLQVFDTNAYSTSLTAGLGEAPRALPAAGPLDEREIHMRLTSGPAPRDAAPLSPRSDAAPAFRSNASSSSQFEADTSWLAAQTRHLVTTISAPVVPLHVTVLALLAAIALGALHALSPGHGKSIVGAYLVGSRGTPRHAVFLGATVTVTHTLIVFALGAVTLVASRFILPERMLPILSFLSGLLVLGTGLTLLAQRWKAARLRAPHHGHAHGDARHHRHDDHDHDHDPDHAHDHDCDHDHGHAEHSQHHSPGPIHSHGGAPHSHMPPGADGRAVTWRGLLALGVSGGLLPCPSAMVLLLAAVALNKTVFGLVLVAAFSVGLAATLTAVGLIFLYARNRLQPRLQSARWPHLLPILSAASITVLGCILCIGTVVSGPP